MPKGFAWRWPSKEEILEIAAQQPSIAGVAGALGVPKTTFKDFIDREGYRQEVVKSLRGGIDRPVVAASSPSYPSYADDLYALLRKQTKQGGMTISELADELNCAPKQIRECVEELVDDGRHIHRSGEIVSAYVMPGLEESVTVDIEPKERLWLGVVSDTHLGSCLQQPTLCKAFMERSADRFDLSGWVHVGDATDGQGVYRGQEHETWIHGADDQAEYFAEAYPDTGVPTWIVSGNHDYVHISKAGADVIARIAEKRDDVHPIGHRGGYLDIGGLSVYLWHPTGGASYAKSYKLQKRVEGFSDTNKPHVLLTGHLHQFVWVWHRNVHAFLVPSWQQTSVFIRSLGHESMIGGIVLEVGFDDNGVPVEVTPHLSKYDPIDHDYPRW